MHCLSPRDTDHFVRQYFILNWFSPQFYAGAGVLVGFELLFRHQFEKRKVGWMKRTITPELVRFVPLPMRCSSVCFEDH